MYEEFFKFKEKPFSIQPDPSFLYWGRTHRLAYAMLEYGVLNHAGISVVTGEVGCGKTTLIHRLLDQLSDSHTVALLSNVQEGRGDLLSWVLMGYGQPFSGKSHVEQFSELQSFFISEYAKGKRVVLIIDEAQNLSLDMLEELRLLSNINAGKDQLLQLILVGQPQLKGMLNRPELLQLAQRVGSDFHLTPLNKEEVQAYIETRLAIAGCKKRIFTERAINLIAKQSRGVPRIINVIADTALVYAFSSETRVVGVEIIRSVIRDKTDYGVFGIASDENAAPPMPSRGSIKDNISPSMEDGKYDDDDSDDFGDVNDLEKYDEEPYTPPVRRPRPRNLPEEKQEGDLKTTVHAELETAETRQASVERKIRREDSAVTGVIVVGTDPNVSPEAAIRSAGDGRAIVFVPVGAAPEAVDAARKAGAIIVDGNERLLNTGGRARNAGYRQLKKIAPHIRYVQFIDSDCALDPDWITTAERFLERRPEVAIVEGMMTDRNEREIEYATLSERRQNEDTGDVPLMAGRSALMRAEAFESAGGFRGDLPVCESHDLCVRQRRRGMHVWRLDDNMLICDVGKPTLGRWWSKSVSRGYKNAYLASLHGGPPDRLGVKESGRAVVWGAFYPLVIIAAGLAAWFFASYFPVRTRPEFIVAGVVAAGLSLYVLGIIASAFWRGFYKPSSWRKGSYAVMGRIPEFFGVLKFWTGGGKEKRERASS